MIVEHVLEAHARRPAELRLALAETFIHATPRAAGGQTKDVETILDLSNRQAAGQIEQCGIEIDARARAKGREPVDILRLLKCLGEDGLSAPSLLRFRADPVDIRLDTVNEAALLPIVAGISARDATGLAGGVGCSDAIS